jgi:hypothetical protein
MKTYRGVQVSSTFSTSALDGGEWSVSLPDHSALREIAPGFHLIGGWVGLKAGLDAVEKRIIFPLSGIELQLLGPYPVAISG